MEVFEGRPADASGRSAAEKAAYDLLDSLGIPYRRADHPAAWDMEACAAIDAALGTRMCKNLFLTNRQKTAYYLLMMDGSKPFRTKELSAQLGVARLSFADETAMRELLGLTPGSVTVLGLMNDRERRVALLIDRDVLAGETVGVHPCVNTSSLRVRTRDIAEKFLPAVGHAYTEVTLTGAEA